jgi:predicted dehydrogenase
MTEQKVRVAFIGAGRQSNWRHYPSVASLPDAEIVALCDWDAGKAEETAKRWNVPKTYQRMEQMLDETDPDAVYVIMGPQAVHEPLMHVLRRGKHVFIEKPPGVTLNGIQVYAHYAEVNSCLTMVGFQRRFLPVMTALKARVEERGPLHSVSVANLKSISNFDAPASSGVLDQLTSDGMHAVDNLRWLAGGEVERVSSHVRTRYVPGSSANAVMAQVEFDNGAVGQLHYSFATGGGPLSEGATAPGIFRAEIFGRNITAYVDAERQSWIAADNQPPEVFDSSSFGTPFGEGYNYWLGFWHETRHFVDCVKAGVQPSSNFADAVKTWELIEAIKAAAR